MNIPIQLVSERELSGKLSFGGYSIRRLKQDIGPPKATPERLTRAKQIVRLAVDKPSLRHPRIARKSIPQAARHAFVGELASEFEQWLGFALAGQQASKQLSSLNSILSAMRLLKRRQLRRRRERRHP